MVTSESCCDSGFDGAYVAASCLLWLKCAANRAGFPAAGSVFPGIPAGQPAQGSLDHLMGTSYLCAVCFGVNLLLSVPTSGEEAAEMFFAWIRRSVLQLLCPSYVCPFGDLSPACPGPGIDEPAHFRVHYHCSKHQLAVK